MHKKISGTIITLNEAQHIEACIKSLQRVCDEVIVVDSNSQDNTAELAEKAGAKVYLQAYLGDGPQKGLTEQYASHDWILNLDADERLEEDAINAIQRLTLDAEHVPAYALRRRNFVGSHWVRAAGFYPDYVVRLYHRRKAAYLPLKRHAYVKAEVALRLDAHIAHYTFNSYSDWVKRVNVLSDIDAGFMYQEGIMPAPWKPTVHACTAFFRKLILKGGLFQGQDGMTVTLTTAFRTYLKYLKLQEIYDRDNKKA